MQKPSGIKFPFRFSDAGGVQLAEGAEKVGSNLSVLAITQANQRLIRKAVGSIGYSTVLRNTGETGRRAAQSVIREAIVQFEPRAVLRSLTVTEVNTDTGTAVVAEGTYVFRPTGEETTFRTVIV